MKAWVLFGCRVVLLLSSRSLSYDNLAPFDLTGLGVPYDKIVTVNMQTDIGNGSAIPLDILALIGDNGGQNIISVAIQKLNEITAAGTEADFAGGREGGIPGFENISESRGYSPPSAATVLTEDDPGWNGYGRIVWRFVVGDGSAESDSMYGKVFHDFMKVWVEVDPPAVAVAPFGVVTVGSCGSDGQIIQINFFQVG